MALTLRLQSLKHMPKWAKQPRVYGPKIPRRSPRLCWEGVAGPLKGLAVNLPSSKACMLKRTLFNLKQKRSATATIILQLQSHKESDNPPTSLSATTLGHAGRVSNLFHSKLRSFQSKLDGTDTQAAVTQTYAKVG